MDISYQKKGVVVDPAKIQANIEWLVLITAKGVYRFFSLAGYHQKFISRFGGIAAPLTHLLDRDGFTWNFEIESAF